jgi:hypothetical protein
MENIEIECDKFGLSEVKAFSEIIQDFGGQKDPTVTVTVY